MAGSWMIDLFGQITGMPIGGHGIGHVIWPGHAATVMLVLLDSLTKC
jgi:hypothetical protein